MAIIAIEDIGKTYGRGNTRSTVLQGIALQVQPGAVVGLLGPNGAGKTTLIKILCGLLRPDAGGGTVLGYDLLRAHHQIRAHVSLVSTTADVGIDNNLTVRQNLAFWTPIYGIVGAAARTRIDELLHRLNLVDKADAWPMHISAGQRQRLALARSLLARNPLVFLDEPTNKLDFEGVRSVRALIAEMNRAEGVTILLTTHVMEEAEELCSEIALLHQGRLLMHLPTQQLMQSLHLARPLEVIARGDDISDQVVIAQIAALPGVSAVQGKETQGTLMTLRLDSVDLRATTPALLDWLRQRGWNLVSLRGEPVTLEEVFLKIMTAQDMGVR